MVEAAKVVFGEEPVKIEAPPEGFHNSNPESRERIIKGGGYRDCSTICLMPTPNHGNLNYKVTDSQKGMIPLMNQRFTPIRIVGMEVAAAYNEGLTMIMNSPELSKWRFLLTWEHDNVAPPNGLVKLVETMYGGPWAAVGGLYWTKGEMGQPMIYGDVNDPEPNFRPLVPQPDSVQECRGLAMGFTLWDMKLFKNKQLGPPWFRTYQHWDAATGVKVGTQDLEFCGRAGALGYRFAVDTSVRVGHVQLEDSPTHPAGFVW